MSSTIPTADEGDSTRPTATTQGPGTSRPRRRVLAILLAITVLCAGVLAWWHPWDKEEEAPPPPETVCNGLYNTAELNQILGSHIGSDHVLSYGAWEGSCTIVSGMPTATDARGYEISKAIMYVYFWHDNEYQAGNGYKWTDKAMAADTENNIQKLDIPELEGHTYLWVAPIGSRDYVHGIWFGDGFTIAAVIPYSENNLDGPKTIQEAVDVMPELLTYIGTNALKHPAIPKRKPSEHPSSTDPSDAADTTSTGTSPGAPFPSIDQNTA
ncbi:hypothetical protein [Actinomyces ruminicola]|uniref:Uncharacterized protein n=1 Tax=Actinomyces ruminicola TaxID=332524 RepID=A0A1G9V1U2_9ACTO|nr:hypothetical protein [Actinomyces ruminicola]SDM66194.1 hypothetical protein SAMN04487766_10568 [Actinomyces ruminicola]